MAVAYRRFFLAVLGRGKRLLKIKAAVIQFFWRDLRYLDQFGKRRKEKNIMQTYEGYVENGRFFPVGGSLSVTGRRRAFVTVLNEPARDDETVRRLGALDKFFAEIESSDEKVPEFERVKLREVEI